MGRTREIMVALDDREENFYVLEWALNYLLPPDSIAFNHFLILWVVNSQEVPSAGEGSGNFEENQKLMFQTIGERMKDLCEKHKITEYEVKIVSGEAKTVICEAANRLVVDLLVVGDQKYGIWERLFSFNSLGDYCVHHAKCPVIVVKRR